MFHWDATGALARLKVPALVIGGDKDIVTKLEASQVIVEESGGRASLRVVEGVNHMGPMERADLYNALIADFVLAVQPGATLNEPTGPWRPRAEFARPNGAPTEPRPSA
jgi:hypothetical protein